MGEWTDRERTRLESGHYKPLPPAIVPSLPANDPRAIHFPHLSKEDAALIAYTQSPDKGERDIKTKIKPGAYLRKFFSDRLDAPAIARIAASFRALTDPATKLHIAETPEECVAAYLACSSCVSYAGGGFKGPVHPASVYGSPDPRFVTVAYLKRDGRITARALINRVEKRYTSSYGDTSALTPILEANGYTRPDYNALVGCAIHAIPAPGTTPDGRPLYVAPSIDGHTLARHDAALKAHVLLTSEQFATVPKAEQVRLGYYNGLSA